MPFPKNIYEVQKEIKKKIKKDYNWTEKELKKSQSSGERQYLRGCLSALENIERDIEYIFDDYWYFRKRRKK